MFPFRNGVDIGAGIQALQRVLFAGASALLVFACGPTKAPAPDVSTTTQNAVQPGTNPAIAAPPIVLPEFVGSWSVSETSQYFGGCVTDHWFLSQNELRYKCLCEGKIYAKAWTFKEFEDKSGQALSRQQSDEIAGCVVSALSENSDQEDAKAQVELWNRRQIEYFADICKDSVLEKRPKVTRGDAQGYCRCQMRFLAAKIPVIDFAAQARGSEAAVEAAETSCKDIRPW